jgi:hypothetical protein
VVVAALMGSPAWALTSQPDLPAATLDSGDGGGLAASDPDTAPEDFSGTWAEEEAFAPGAAAGALRRSLTAGRRCTSNSGCVGRRVCRGGRCCIVTVDNGAGCTACNTEGVCAGCGNDTAGVPMVLSTFDGVLMCKTGRGGDCTTTGDAGCASRLCRSGACCPPSMSPACLSCTGGGGRCDYCAPGYALTPSGNCTLLLGPGAVCNASSPEGGAQCPGGVCRGGRCCAVGTHPACTACAPSTGACTACGSPPGAGGAGGVAFPPLVFVNGTCKGSGGNLCAGNSDCASGPCK